MTPRLPLALCLALLLAPSPRLRAQAPASAEPGTPLTAADVTRLALEQNPGLAAFRLESAAARADVRTAGLRPNPVLTTFFDPLDPIGLTVTRPIFQYGMTVQLPLELGGRRPKRVAAALATARATAFSVSDSARRTVLAAAQARIDLLLATARRQLADSVLGTFDQLVRLNESRLEEKQIAGVELQRVEVARSQALVDRDAAVLAERQAQDALALLLGLPGRPVLADTLAPSAGPVLPADSLVALALRQRPDVRAADAALEAATATIAVADAETHLLPSVGVDVGGQQGARYLGVSGSVALPFFDRNQGNRARARVREEQSGRLADAIRLAAATDVRSAATELEARRAALTEYDAANPDGILARARAIRATADFSYRRGSTSLLELLDAQRTFADLARGYAEAVAGYERARLALAAASAAGPDLADLASH